MLWIPKRPGAQDCVASSPAGWQPPLPQGGETLREVLIKAFGPAIASADPGVQHRLAHGLEPGVWHSGQTAQVSVQFNRFVGRRRRIVREFERGPSRRS